MAFFSTGYTKVEARSSPRLSDLSLSQTLLYFQMSSGPRRAASTHASIASAYWTGGTYRTCEQTRIRRNLPPRRRPVSALPEALSISGTE